MTKDFNKRLELATKKPFLELHNNFIKPEIKFVETNMSGFDIGFKFWAASAYAKGYLSKNERVSFLTKFTNSSIQSNQTVDIDWTQAVDPAKYFNIIKPLLVLIQTAKHAAADAVEHNNNALNTESNTKAKLIKAALEILILPIELPIKLTDKLIDLTLLPVSIAIKQVERKKEREKSLVEEIKFVTGQSEENLNLNDTSESTPNIPLREFVSHKKATYIKRNFDNMEYTDHKPREWTRKTRLRYEPKYQNLSQESLIDSKPQPSENNLRPWAKRLLDSDENTLSQPMKILRAKRINSSISRSI
ncbi:MAG: hypothetical protein ACK4OM_03765 [Alphaproteobacteria bacterium]